jgi:hypothetical protein
MFYNSAIRQFLRSVASRKISLFICCQVSLTHGLALLVTAQDILSWSRSTDNSNRTTVTWWATPASSSDVTFVKLQPISHSLACWHTAPLRSFLSRCRLLLWEKWSASHHLYGNFIDSNPPAPFFPALRAFLSRSSLGLLNITCQKLPPCVTELRYLKSLNPVKSRFMCSPVKRRVVGFLKLLFALIVKEDTNKRHYFQWDKVIMSTFLLATVVETRTVLQSEIPKFVAWCCSRLVILWFKYRSTVFPA